MKNNMKRKLYDNVFEAIEDDPAMAENLRHRACMMTLLRDYVEQRRLTKKEALRRMNVTEQSMSDLLNGKIERFTTDMLSDMLAHTGIQSEFLMKQAA